MTTRRRLLALATGVLPLVSGCLDGAGGGGDADRTTVTGDLPEWEPAWTLETAFSNVLGVDAGPDRLYLTLNDEGGQSAVAAVRRGETSLGWRRSFEGDASGGNPGSPDDHRDQWGVLVAGGTVYGVHGRADSYEWTALHALDAESGDERWSVRRERDLSVLGVRDGTVLASGLEFFEPEHSHDAPEDPLETVLYGIDASSGQEQWTASFHGVEDVAVGPESVLVATPDAVTAVGFDGAERWRGEPSGEIRSIAALDGALIVATGTERFDSTIRGFDSGGTEQWSRSLPVNALIARGGRAYGFGRVVTALETDGAVAWERPAYGDEPTFSSSGDRLYTRAGSQADAVDAYDLPDGRRAFRFDAPADDAWPVAATDDAVVAEAITPDVADFTSLFAVAAESGEPRAVYRPTENVSDSEAVGGTVYTGFGDGTLAAFETGEW